MTVKEAVEVLTTAKLISIAWGGSLVAEFKPNNKIMLEAFSHYRIDTIHFAHDCGEDNYELTIAAVPAKEDL